MKYLKPFIVGFFAGILVFLVFLKTKIVSEDKALGIKAETVKIVPTSKPTPTFTSTPTPTLSPAPTLTPAPTLSPKPTLTSTPTPIPTPIVAPAHLENLFKQYAVHYGINEQLLIRIAWCESRFNPAAVNGPYVGLYQFTKERWITHRTAMGHDINPELRVNAEESIKTAAYLISLGKLFMWPNCVN